ncbi:MAG TPA: aminopeptidase P family N-terminal domain-containing protein, partial [Thermoanaerobaculia bacterium]|nr:aminopeptidase P family N-terminal domain-containing protein [Thermoanaerobaculia bacterium]
MSLSRRELLRLGGAAATAAALPAAALPAAARAAEEQGAPCDAALPAALAELEPMTAGVEPIATDEHRARLRRAQALRAAEGLDALVVGPGTSLAYFTGARWGLSERFFGFVLTREGDPAWVTPAFEALRAGEQIAIGGDVRPWQEDESPY